STATNALMTSPSICAYGTQRALLPSDERVERSARPWRSSMVMPWPASRAREGGVSGQAIQATLTVSTSARAATEAVITSAARDLLLGTAERADPSLRS